MCGNFSQEIEEVKKVIRQFKEGEDYLFHKGKKNSLINISVDGEMVEWEKYTILNLKLKKLLWELNEKIGGNLASL